jgi:hypothetical protein
MSELPVGVHREARAVDGVDRQPAPDALAGRAQSRAASWNPKECGGNELGRSGIFIRGRRAMTAFG